MNRKLWWMMVCAAALSLAVPFTVRQAAAEEADEATEYVSLSAGFLDYAGDDRTDDGISLTARVGFDLTEWLSLEGGYFVAPYLKEKFYQHYPKNSPPGGVRTSRWTDKPSTESADSAIGTGIFADGLYHFTRWERLDPFLAVGVGMTWYSKDMGGDSLDLDVRGGGGAMYHFNDEWAIRADYRAMLVHSSKATANSMLDAGVVWYWGARVPQKIVASGGLNDTDGDGLLDDEEPTYGTDPLDPDTDKDGLSDGDEVHKWKTDPLNPDTDYDSLTDGYDEVMKYKTDPTKRDTDNGGVADGHEVREDSTDPLNPADDLILFELYIQFDYDKAILKDKYFKDLDVIAKVLKRNPGSEARVEGHADRMKKSNPRYNKNLSQKRAESVVKYLVENDKIDGKRFKAVGYGFERPKGPNDPIVGNPVNRRVEVYIRGAEGEKKLTGTVQADVPAPAVGP
jgi:outer membrane protein OmpA-like peptidoglycan-associated protein